LECTAQQKPLVLLALLLEEKTCPSRTTTTTTTTTQDICVVFTSSVESTHRLTRLLQLLWSTAEYGSSHAVAEFSSALNQKERSELLRRCTAATDDDTTTTNETRVEILVCSDGMSRGMDLSQVSTVINYDIPTFAKTYVHRCGRTARGGQEGKVINLIKQGQVTSFHKMRSWIEDKDRVKSLTVQKYLQKNVVPVYKDCVKRLGLLIAAEKRGEISPTDCVHLNSI
jgi:ATP-dependent RNA helicase DDX51/DBP6